MNIIYLSKKARKVIFLLMLFIVLAPTQIFSAPCSISYTSHEQQLFDSLRTFLSSRHSQSKHWRDWVDEWIRILAPAGNQYDKLRAKLKLIRTWNKATPIASALDTALQPYLERIPQDITAQADTLGKKGLIDLIAQYL